ncbi:60S ribosomal protein L14 [Papilio machaon]|uniref:Large ribosomal subunit protein eL14 n=2 Tax=Papilio TaxID=7145 RepID=I4DIM7_PAPXU|nr:60S ribosomal protein L14 [Papilio xuthus]XP_014359521.1 60S ribosomal protein L14 [Papilio machaon]KPI91680.1 60S ribosomal protein L14 [Papilio xuthus]KPJ14297.1 60S ribosomal protein L14 [Papilio machaon]BAM17767.1 ribosomal protein L14 [Papilio xuthus]
MPFARFVQPGRVALVAEGPLKGKLVSVVDVIDQTRALVDGPGSGVPRQQIRLNQLHLTKFRLKFPFTAPTRVVRKAWTDEKLNEKWAESQWSKKLENKEKRAQMTDYDRFKLSSARVKRNRARTPVFKSLKAQAARKGVFGKKKVPKASVKKPRVKKETSAKKPAKK